MSVEDFIPDLGKAERAALQQIKEAAASAKSRNLAELEEQKKITRREISNEVEGDLKKFAWKMGGGFGVGLVLFFALFSYVSSEWMPAAIKNWDKRADEATKKALEEHSILTDIEALRNEVNRRQRVDDLSDLAKRLEELEQRTSELAKQNAKAVPPTQE